MRAAAARAECCAGISAVSGNALVATAALVGHAAAATARELRSRELDFFVAETSTLQREPELEIAPMPSAHSVHFFARADHPLAGHGTVGVTSEGPPLILDCTHQPTYVDPQAAICWSASARVCRTRFSA